MVDSDVAAMGGRARAAKLTADERARDRQAAAEKRWGGGNKAGLPKETHPGVLTDRTRLEIPVLRSRQRSASVFSTKRRHQRAVGGKRTGTQRQGRRRANSCPHS